MKKTLAILLALAMVFSTITVAFAEESISADAKSCQTLGMLQGDGKGVSAAYLAQTPNRLTAAILFLRLKGLEKEALAYTGAENFADANQVNWAGGKAILGYLKANPQLGWVGENGNFKANDAMTAQAYYKVMLETLGYKQKSDTVVGDFEWAKVLEFAASKGLSKAATATNFTVNDVATATVEALKATVNGSTKTLAAQLVEAKVITETAAVDAGVYTVAPATLAVESVTATNLKEVVVKFNKAVDKDSAEDEDNYAIDIDDVDQPIDSASLAADGKTVTLVLVGEFTNGAEFNLDVQDVEDTTGKAIEDVTVEATANDVAAPVAEKVTLTGPHTFEITFSEPIDKDVEGSVEVDKDEYPVASYAADDTNTVVVTMSDSELEAKDYKVAISEYKDLAGHKMVAKDFTLAYVKDTTAPTATISSVKQTEVKVKFSEKVFAGDPDANQALDENYFYHSLSSYKPDSISVSTDGKTYTLNYPDGTNPLPEGNVKVVVVYDANDEVVTDAWGNELTSNITLTAAVNADTTKPVVSKVETDGQDTLNVYFSENVNADEATDFENYTVLNADSEEQTISDITYSNDDDEYVATIVFSGDLDPDKYTIKVADIHDMALEANKMTAATVSFEVNDEVGPTVPATSIALDGTSADTIYIDFGEDMASTGAYSALDKNNYQINGNDLDKADTVAFFNGDKSIVKITIADETDYNFAGGILVDVARLADAAGNKMEDISGTTTARYETAPTFNAVRVIDGKTVEIRVNGHIKDTTAASAFEVYDVSDGGSAYGTLSAIKSITWVPDYGYTKIVGVLKAGQQLPKDSDDHYMTGVGAHDLYVRPVTNAVKTIFGTAMAVTVFGDTENITDKFAPSLETIKNTAVDTITLTFTEAIRYITPGDDTLAASDLVIKDSDGTRLAPNVDYTTVATGDTLVVTLADDYVGYNGRLSVDTAANINYLADGTATTANKVVAFNKTVTMDATAPFVRSVVENENGTITITFNEVMDETLAETEGNYRFSGGTVSSAILDSTGKVVTLTLSVAADENDTITVSFGGSLTDVVGNVLAQDVWTK